MTILTFLILIIWCLSLLGITTIVWKKSFRLSLSEIEGARTEQFKLPALPDFLKIKTPQKIILLFSGFSFIKILDKSLVKLRIFILKAENNITVLLQRLRQKSSKDMGLKGRSVKPKEPKDSYWEKLKEDK